MKLRLPAAIAAALLAPVCIVTAILVWLSAAERVGARPFAGLAPRNSAEAAALANAGELLRFLGRGEDPHAVYPVRPEVISSAILRATTVEAAMWSRQVEMIKLLDREGIIRDDERGALTCLAEDLQIEDVVEHLAGEGGGNACQPGRALARVASRTGMEGGAE